MPPKLRGVFYIPLAQDLILVKLGQIILRIIPQVAPFAQIGVQTIRVRDG